MAYGSFTVAWIDSPFFPLLHVQIIISLPTVEITNPIWHYAHLSLYLCIQRKFMVQNTSPSDDCGDSWGTPICSIGPFSYTTLPIRALWPHHSHRNCWCDGENVHLVCPEWCQPNWIRFAVFSKHLHFTQNCSVYARNGGSYCSSWWAFKSNN